MQRSLMAHKAETTFGDLQTEERFRRLERSLKLALLKREHDKSAHNRKPASPMPIWPSISSINADTLDSSYVTPSLQISRIGSEVLASSANLKNMFSTRKDHNAKQETMTTSSVKRYNVKQDSHTDRCIMPPPITDRVSHAKKILGKSYTSLHYEKSVSTPLNGSIQSTAITNCSSQIASSPVSINTNDDEKYLHSFVTPVIPIDNLQKVERVFLKWKVMLNDQQQLIIKGIIDDGRVVHSKPIIKRYTATCVGSIYKHKYNLQGNIVDERNELPDYIHGKFYNGFPDDWENVYQIWKTFVNQRCPVTFRWPTAITDSDDDLKSELTDFTYINRANDKLNTTGSYESNRFTRQLIDSEDPDDKSSEKIEKCLNCAHSSHNYEKDRSFVKSSFPDIEKDIAVIALTKNNEDSKQNSKTNVNTLYSSGRTNRLMNILQEDKLNVIINNLADKNCSPKYIDKILEMVDCLQYLVSYRSESEHNPDMFSANCEMSKSNAVPLQEVLTCNKENRVNPNQFEIIMEPKSHVHSSDLGYGSIKIDSNPSQSCHARNIESECDGHKDSDKSESEIYAGIPKILMDRVLQVKRGSEKTFRRKKRKRTVRSDARKYENSDQDVASVNRESNNNSLDKPCLSRDLHKECIEQTKREATVAGSKPIITSSIPLNKINLNIKINDTDSQKTAQSHVSDISIIENEKQCTSIRFPAEFLSEKPVLKVSTSMKSTSTNNSHLKAMVDSKKDNCTISNAVYNKKDGSDDTNFVRYTKSTTNSSRQSKNNKRGADNPKLLIAWMPKVVYNSKSKTELGLIFQGKLLNDVGHVVHRKFTTDIVFKRLSATLIETINHEFYQLVGCLNDNNHVIPKKLVKECRNGCPAKIEQFCLMWKSLQHAEMQTVGGKLHDTSVDFLNVPVSSKGRKILPPLSYWTGERITLKDNTPVYDLGNSQESSLASLNDSPDKNIKEGQKHRIYRRSVSKSRSSASKQKPLYKTNEISSTKKNQMVVVEKDQSLNKSLSVKAADSTKTLDNAKEYRQAAINSKRKITQQLIFSSSDSDQNEQDVSPQKRIHSFQSNASADAKTSSKYGMKLRKRQRLQKSPNKASHKDANKSKYDTTRCSSIKKSRHNVMYAYYQGIPLPQDLLSEEQMSPT